MTYGDRSNEERGGSSKPWMFFPFYLHGGEGTGQSRGPLFHVSATLLLIISETREKKEGKSTDIEIT